jgi:NAD(P)-dependent dehydrogenase (short-subunit alcohol dehydrogenase family)
MPTIAIVGAGPGMGLSIAKVFGGHGFQVALISRSKDKLDALVAQLAETGITAAFPADVADFPALTSALDRAAAGFGAIDVLEYSPYGGLDTVRPR